MTPTRRSRTVVHVSDSRDFGGTEQVILQILGGLDRGAWRPVLVRQPDAHPRLGELAGEIDVECVALPLSGGVRGMAAAPRLASAIRALRPAVLHAHLTDPLSCKFVLLAAALARVPAIVATVHLFLEMTDSHLPRLQHKVVSAGVDRYIAVSDHIGRSLRRRFGVTAAKLRVIHNGVASAASSDAAPRCLRQQLAGDRDRPIVLTVARLEEQKGHRYLLDAAVSVPDAVFLFAGEGHARTALERQARDLRIADRVRFLGLRTDIPALLASCDLFVLPSLNEGLPLTVLEAMAAARPVVATSIAGTDEAVVHGHTGLLVPPAEAEPLGRAIRTMLDDAARAERFGLAGRTRASSTFSVDRMVDGVRQVYEELLH
jgi:glycosyltransferase involved in cell wall biosynthesis